MTLDKKPAEKWYGKKPDLSSLEIFGSVAYAKILGPLKKLDIRSKEAIIVRYTMNGYRLWDPVKRKILNSRDVVFKEGNSKSEIRKIYTFIFHFLM